MKIVIDGKEAEVSGGIGGVTLEQIQEAVDWLNHYPRKILGWKCAADFSAPGAPRS